MSADDTLFEADPAPSDAPNSSGLANLHRIGEPLVREHIGDTPAVVRVRDYAPCVGNPRRAYEVTIRYTTPGHRLARDWKILACGEADVLATGWVGTTPTGDPVLHHLIVLDAAYLTEDVLDRPGCLVPASRSSVLHHAPGGAEFLVVDARRVRRETVKFTRGIVLDPSPAQTVVQEGLF